jgi:ABC-type sugar transport system substrate-binding protein
MPLEVKIRRFSGAVSGTLFAIAALAAGAFAPASAAAQTGEPVKIGYSMALTGGLGPNGRSALLAQKIWEEDTNAKGGLLGRPVKLIYDDDQTEPDMQISRIRLSDKTSRPIPRPYPTSMPSCSTSTGST